MEKWEKDTIRVKGYIVGKVREIIKNEGEDEETVLIAEPTYWTKLKEA